MTLKGPTHIPIQETGKMKKLREIKTQIKQKMDEDNFKQTAITAVTSLVVGSLLTSATIIVLATVKFRRMMAELDQVVDLNDNVIFTGTSDETKAWLGENAIEFPETMKVSMLNRKNEETVMSIRDYLVNFDNIKR